MNILGYNEFLKEGSSIELSSVSRVISTAVNEIMKRIVKAEFPIGKDYYNIFNYEIANDNNLADIKVFIRKDNNPNFSEDPHFNNMKWERHRFKEDGFAIDANTFIEKNAVPEIQVSILIDPDRAVIRPGVDSYDKIYNKLNNLVDHELNHTHQIGINRSPFKTIPSHKDHRDNSNNNNYFTLPEEIESMVSGMYRQSKLENVPLDNIFDKHLNIYVKDKFITEDQKLDIIHTWIEYALINYPDSSFSAKYYNFINKI
jgi:hypothetical protein